MIKLYTNTQWTKNPKNWPKPLKKRFKKPKFCIDFVSQPSNDLILSIFKCLEILGTLVLESIWMGITKFVIFWQIKAKTEHVLKGIYIFHLQDFVIGIHWKSTNFNKKNSFCGIVYLFSIFHYFFQYHNGKWWLCFT